MSLGIRTKPPQRSRSMMRAIIGALAAAALVTAGLASAPTGTSDAVEAAATTSYGIWSDSIVPRNPADPETKRVKLGVKFKSSVDGYVSAVQFYRSSANAGPHTGQLWTAGGTLLAQVNFPTTTATGWLTANFSKPVKLTAGRTYVASYIAPRGRYAADTYALSPTKPAVNQALTATQGVYTYGTGLPTRTWRNSNYYVDVVFSPASTTASPTATTSSSPTATTSSSPSATAYGIWSDSVVPQHPADPETTRVNLGVRFKSSVDGYVSAVQFYRSPANAGPHTGQLWAADGTLLAQVDFPSTTATGWLTANFSSPVKLTADTTYVASYTAPSGRYAADSDALSPTKPAVNQALTGTQGVYTYGSGVPTETWQNSNYYVDVVFSPASTTASPTAPTTTATSTATATQTATATATVTPEPSSTPTASPATWDCVLTSLYSRCGPWGLGTYSNYIEYPHITGTRGGTSGGSPYVDYNLWSPIEGQQQTVRANNPGDWMVSSLTPRNPTGSVTTFPNTGAPFDEQPLSSFSSIVSSVAQTMPHTPGTSAWAMYDNWFDDWRYEVMIQHDFVGNGPCDFVKVARFGGSNGVPERTWGLCRWGNVFAWKLAPDTATVGSSATINEAALSFDLKAMTEKLVEYGYMDPDPTITNLSYGWEISSTNGVEQDFKVTKYELHATR